jgi:hypothetical protein
MGGDFGFNTVPMMVIGVIILRGTAIRSFWQKEFSKTAIFSRSPRRPKSVEAGNQNATIAERDFHGFAWRALVIPVGWFCRGCRWAGPGLRQLRRASCPFPLMIPEESMSMEGMDKLRNDGDLMKSGGAMMDLGNGGSGVSSIVIPAN